MDVAIIHHHLNRGGVTQVIRAHLQVFDSMQVEARPRRILICTGPGDTGWDSTSHFASLNVRKVVLPCLGYDSETPTPPAALENELVKTLTANGLSAVNSILHVHNPTLGKKTAWPTAIASLADQGWRWLMHLHDFAEDFRFENYRRLEGAAPDKKNLETWLYPGHPNVDFAVLNHRDYEILSRLGHPREQVHLLPNPVLADWGSSEPTNSGAIKSPALQERLGVEGKQKLVVYPVRGIRRKNLPEFLLWSTLSTGDVQFAQTLPAESPLEVPLYENCRTLAEELNLPIWWEVGLDNEVTFGEWIDGADAIISTSVAEGFGLVFLESLANGKVLLGRDLIDITVDFKQAGLSYEAMSAEFRIPRNLLDEEEVSERIATQYSKVIERYGGQVNLQAGMDEIASQFGTGAIDFARLPLVDQLAIIRQSATDIEVRDAIRGCNPWLEHALTFEQPVAQVVSQDRERLRSCYGQEPIGQQLANIYSGLLSRPAPQSSSPTNTEASHFDNESTSHAAIATWEGHRPVLQQFLRLDRFYPVRLAKKESK